MTIITIEVEIPFDDFLHSLNQLTESELTQLIEYASTLLSDDERQSEEKNESEQEDKSNY